MCMRVCMSACLHVYIYACVHVCMYAYMPECVHACMHVCIYACMYLYMCSCMHVCMYACAQVCMYVCMHVCLCTYMQVEPVIPIFLAFPNPLTTINSNAYRLSQNFYAIPGERGSVRNRFLTIFLWEMMSSWFKSENKKKWRLPLWGRAGVR